MCKHKRTAIASDDGIYQIMCLDCPRNWDEQQWAEWKAVRMPSIRIERITYELDGKRFFEGKITRELAELKKQMDKDNKEEYEWISKRYPVEDAVELLF